MTYKRIINCVLVLFCVFFVFCFLNQSNRLKLRDNETLRLRTNKLCKRLGIAASPVLLSYCLSSCFEPPEL